ncbi:MAG TPA: SDR family oxidoreductase [Acetobacteraceae bacterium]
MRILITGAAGLLGRELTGHLSGRGHGVVALQHRNTALRRNDGRPISAASWTGSLARPGEVATLAGDVEQPNLGLPKGLLTGFDLVVHCAAVTGFALPAETYDSVNIRGTANVLASTGETPVLHVSTAYVCGRRYGPICEDDGDGGHGFHNGYERSKAAAEALVASARAAGRTVAIARPSIVVGDSETGVIGVFGSIYGLIRLVAEGRIGTLPAAPGATLNLVPIDHVIGGLTDIAENMQGAAGRTFHLVSGCPVPVSALAGLAYDYPMLYAPRLVTPEQFDPGALLPNERSLVAQVSALLEGYLQNNPCFDDRNLQAFSSRQCPATGQPFLRRLVDHCLATGYVTARRQAAA